jgi:predicted nucleic acid-binding protein
LFLKRHRKIGLDTSIFIFQIEENLRYAELSNLIFEWVEKPRSRAVTSTITMLEMLVQPYRDSALDRVNNFYALLSTYPNLEWIEPTLEIADLGARLRAEHNLRTPDAIQAATALACQATGYLSNDGVFRLVLGLEVMILEDLLGSGEADIS